MKVKHLKIKLSQKGGQGLFTTKPIERGITIFRFKGRIGQDKETNSESLQIEENKFLESTPKYNYQNFLNHSCNPNAFIDFKILSLTALKNIEIDEEVTYNYCTSEYDLISLVEDCSFTCNCGFVDCICKVKGFKYLSTMQKESLTFFVAPFIKEKWAGV